MVHHLYISIFVFSVILSLVEQYLLISYNGYYYRYGLPLGTISNETYNKSDPSVFNLSELRLRLHEAIDIEFIERGSQVIILYKAFKFSGPLIWYANLDFCSTNITIRIAFFTFLTCILAVTFLETIPSLLIKAIAPIFFFGIPVYWYIKFRKKLDAIAKSSLSQGAGQGM